MSYGAFLVPAGMPQRPPTTTDAGAQAGWRWLQITDLGLARKLADGNETFVIREEGNDCPAVVQLAGPGQLAMWVMTSTAIGDGPALVQRGTDGYIRVSYRKTIAVFNGGRWKVGPNPIELVVAALEQTHTRDAELIKEILWLAKVGLGAAHVGAIIIWHPDLRTTADLDVRGELKAGFDVGVHFGEDFTAVRHLLAQTDGATLLSADGIVLRTHARLEGIGTLDPALEQLGMRHQAAQIFSKANPEAIVVAVSADGPVTVFHDGDVVSV